MRMNPSREGTNAFRVTTTRHGNMFSDDFLSKEPSNRVQKTKNYRDYNREGATKAAYRRMDYTNNMGTNQKLKQSMLDGSMGMNSTTVTDFQFRDTTYDKLNIMDFKYLPSNLRAEKM